MAKINISGKIEKPTKRTSIGRGEVKTSSMNKHRKRSYKPYRGQGKC